MTKESKYYTPSIEEFHVGYEYEEYCQVILDSNGEWYSNPNWVKKKVEDFGVLRGKYEKTTSKDNIYSSFSPMCLSIQNDHKTPIENWNKNIRVKYLDISDLESLGWRHIYCGGTDEPSFSKLDFFELFIGERKKENHWTLRLDNDKRILIEQGHQWKRFFGTIKNKSELKRLMGQLGIIV